MKLRIAVWVLLTVFITGIVIAATSTDLFSYQESQAVHEPKGTVKLDGKDKKSENKTLEKTTKKFAKVVMKEGKKNITINSTEDMDFDKVKLTKWSYKKTGEDILTFPEGYILYGDYVCDAKDVTIEREGKLGEQKFYHTCIHYEPKYETVVLTHPNSTEYNKTNKIRNFYRIDDTKVKVNWTGFLDPDVTALTVGAVGCWDFDENMNDYFGVLNGSLVGTDVNYTKSPIDGYNLYGYGTTSDYARVNYSVNIFQDDFTMAFRIWDDSIAQYKRFYNYFYDANNFIQIIQDSGNVNDDIHVDIKSGGTLIDQSSQASSWKSNQWYDVVVRFDNSTKKVEIWRNDSNQTQGNVGGWGADTSSTGYMTFGARAGGDSTWTGKLDSWVIWNRRLNDTEILEFHNAEDGYNCSYLFYEEPTPTTNVNLTSNISACYDFDTDVNDYFGIYNGTKIGDADYTTGSSKVGGGSLDCPGSNDAITMSSNIISGSAFTISFWEYSDGTTNTGYFFSDGNDVNNLFFRRLTSSDRWNGQVGDTGGGIEATTARQQWNHFLFLHHSNGTAELYLNGTLQATETGSNFAGITSTFYLCDRQDLARDFDGKIDQLMIWERALNASEISDVYNSHSGRTCSYIETLSESVDPCEYSGSGDWTITNESCILASSVKVLGILKLINSNFTIDTDAELNITGSNYSSTSRFIISPGDGGGPGSLKYYIP